MMTRWSDIDRMFGTMDLLRRKLDYLSGDVDRSVGYISGWNTTEGAPKTNLYDKGDGFELRAEVPGFSKENLNVKIQGNYVEISGTRSQDLPENFRVHRTERRSFNFSRSFTLPSDVDSSKVEATLKNGILVLRLPKSEAAKPKQITVK